MYIYGRPFYLYASLSISQVQPPQTQRASETVFSSVRALSGVWVSRYHNMPFSRLVSESIILPPRSLSNYHHSHSISFHFIPFHFIPFHVPYVLVVLTCDNMSSLVARLASTAYALAAVTVCMLVFSSVWIVLARTGTPPATGPWPA